MTIEWREEGIATSSPQRQQENRRDCGIASISELELSKSRPNAEHIRDIREQTHSRANRQLTQWGLGINLERAVSHRMPAFPST